MSAYRFWEIGCDFRDLLGHECQEVADGATVWERTRPELERARQAITGRSA